MLNSKTSFIQTAMVMAAGLGTRLRPFTDFCAKPFLPVMGVPLLRYTLQSLEAAGVQRIVLNLHHHFQQSLKQIQELRGYFPHLTIEVSDESALLLGSAGGIAHALPLLNAERFFLVNADVLLEMDWCALATHHQNLRKKYPVEWTCALLNKSPTRDSYREFQYDSHSSLLLHLGDFSCDRPFYVGAGVMESSLLHSISKEAPSEFIPSILMPALKKNRIGIYRTQGPWCDIGTPALWFQAHLDLMQFWEEKTLPDSWKKLIETHHQRLAPYQWSRKGFESLSRNWRSPVFWSSLSEEVSYFEECLGPRTILYGESPQGSVKNGIGFLGKWVNLSG